MRVFVDTLTGNFIPYFLVPTSLFSEAFSPMIDLDIQLTNQVSAKFEYRKSRQLSLSLVDFQVSEARSTEFHDRSRPGGREDSRFHSKSNCLVRGVEGLQRNWKMILISGLDFSCEGRWYFK
jgi:hypothetical protein